MAAIHTQQHALSASATDTTHSTKNAEKTFESNESTRAITFTRNGALRDSSISPNDDEEDSLMLL